MFALFYSIIFLKLSTCDERAHLLSGRADFCHFIDSSECQYCMACCFHALPSKANRAFVMSKNLSLTILNLICLKTMPAYNHEYLHCWRCDDSQHHACEWKKALYAHINSMVASSVNSNKLTLLPPHQIILNRKPYTLHPTRSCPNDFAHYMKTKITVTHRCTLTQ